MCIRTEAKELAAWGAELVQADAADFEQLHAAFEGAIGVYGMTFAAWAIEDPQEATAYEYNLGAHVSTLLNCMLIRGHDRPRLPLISAQRWRPATLMGEVRIYVVWA